MCKDMIFLTNRQIIIMNISIVCNRSSNKLSIYHLF